MIAARCSAFIYLIGCTHAICRHECDESAIMCSPNPALTAAQNKGKCVGIASLILGIVGLLNFIGGTTGAIVGAIGSICMLIAGSMLVCCLKDKDQAVCIYTASMILSIFAVVLCAVGIIMTSAMELSLVSSVGMNTGNDAVNVYIGIALVWLYVSVAISAVLVLFGIYSVVVYAKGRKLDDITMTTATAMAVANDKV